MYISYDEDLLITELRVFGDAPKSNFIEVDDSLDRLRPAVGNIKLINVNGSLTLPENLDDQLRLIILARKKAKKTVLIFNEFNSALKSGVPFDFDVSIDTIQTRNQQDLINISGVTTNAMLLKIAGISDAVIPFRAASNKTYMLTPDKAILLGQTVASFTAAHYSTHWSLKDSIAAAQTIDEVEAITWPQ